MCVEPSQAKPCWHATHSNLSLSVSRSLCATDTKQPPTAVMCENENWFWKQKGFLWCAATCRRRDNKKQRWRHRCHDTSEYVKSWIIELGFFSVRVQCIREEMENHRHIFVARLWCRDKSNATQTSASVSGHRLKNKIYFRNEIEKDFFFSLLSFCWMVRF